MQKDLLMLRQASFFLVLAVSGSVVSAGPYAPPAGESNSTESGSTPMWYVSLDLPERVGHVAVLRTRMSGCSGIALLMVCSP